MVPGGKGFFSLCKTACFLGLARRGGALIGVEGDRDKGARGNTDKVEWDEDGRSTEFTVCLRECLFVGVFERRGEIEGEELIDETDRNCFVSLVIGVFTVQVIDEGEFKEATLPTFLFFLFFLFELILLIEIRRIRRIET